MLQCRRRHWGSSSPYHYHHQYQCCYYWYLVVHFLAPQLLTCCIDASSAPCGAACKRVDEVEKLEKEERRRWSDWSGYVTYWEVGTNLESCPIPDDPMHATTSWTSPCVPQEFLSHSNCSSALDDHSLGNNLIPISLLPPPPPSNPSIDPQLLLTARKCCGTDSTSIISAFLAFHERQWPQLGCP